MARRWQGPGGARGRGEGGDHGRWGGGGSPGRNWDGYSGPPSGPPPGNFGGSFRDPPGAPPNHGHGGRFMIGPKGDEDMLRVLLRSSDAGAIIGKSGSNVRELRTKHKCQIHLPESGDSPERLLIVTGWRVNIVQAMRTVLTHIKEPEVTNQEMKPGTKELQILVPEQFMGVIIGRGGDKIRELRAKTDASVKIFREALPNSSERSVSIQGTEEKICEVIDYILEQLSGTKHEDRGRVMFYDPAMMAGGNPDFAGPPPGGRGMGFGGPPRGSGPGGSPEGNFRGPSGPPGGHFGGQRGGPPHDGHFGGPGGPPDSLGGPSGPPGGHHRSPGGPPSGHHGGAGGPPGGHHGGPGGPPGGHHGGPGGPPGGHHGGPGGPPGGHHGGPGGPPGGHHGGPGGPPGGHHGGPGGPGGPPGGHHGGPGGPPGGHHGGPGGPPGLHHGGPGGPGGPPGLHHGGPGGPPMGHQGGPGGRVGGPGAPGPTDYGHYPNQQEGGGKWKGGRKVDKRGDRPEEGNPLHLMAQQPGAVPANAPIVHTLPVQPPGAPYAQPPKVTPPQMQPPSVQAPNPSIAVAPQPVPAQQPIPLQPVVQVQPQAVVSVPHPPTAFTSYVATPASYTTTSFVPAVAQQQTPASITYTSYAQPVVTSSSNAVVSSGVIPQASTVQQVTIPLEYTDSIIGPNGSRLQQTCEQSGCQIRLEEPKPGSTQRIITIIGHQSSIQLAQSLLQNCVRQFHV